MNDLINVNNSDGGSDNGYPVMPHTSGLGFQSRDIKVEDYPEEAKMVYKS